MTYWLRLGVDKLILVIVVWVFQMAVFHGTWIIKEHSLVHNSRHRQAPMKQQYDHKSLNYLGVYSAGTVCYEVALSTEQNSNNKK